MSDMKKWVQDQLHNGHKKAMPILSFPGAQLLGMTVRQLVTDSGAQAACMEAVAKRTDAGAAFSLMDLSVEAEAFGAEVRITDNEVPAVCGRLVNSAEDAEKLYIPDTNAGRVKIFTDAIRKAKALIKDRPVFAGAIGSFSLAGRLMDVTEIMYACYDEPETVHLVLKKATEWITKYCLALREAGADGVVLAEPLAGMIAPDMCGEFSCDYIRGIVSVIQTDDFQVIYHNCGNGVLRMLDQILGTGAAAYHFGNAIDLAEALPRMPKNVLCMGNIDPAGQFANGTPESICAETRRLIVRCSGFPQFVPSSGCDIPPNAKWENIDAFFEAVV